MKVILWALLTTLPLTALLVVGMALGPTSEAHSGPYVKKTYPARFDKPSPTSTATSDWIAWMSLQADVHWQCCKTYGYKPAFENAFDDWSASDTTVALSYGGNIERDHSANYDVHFYMQQLPPLGYEGKIAITRYFYENASGALVECSYSSCPGNKFDRARVYVSHQELIDAFSGALNNSPTKRAVASHELGHVLSLDHEIQGESCSSTVATLPLSIMDYNCVWPTVVTNLPPGSQLVKQQDWDECGVNHNYHDPVIYLYSGCTATPVP